MIGVGLWIGRRVRHAGEFFVAGRRLSPGLLFSTFLAANIGAGSTVNATALAYSEGISAWWWNGSAGLGSVLLAFWIGPRIWRLAKAREYLTVGDFLEDRFGRGVSGLVGVLIHGRHDASLHRREILGACRLRCAYQAPEDGQLEDGACGTACVGHRAHGSVDGDPPRERGANCLRSNCGAARRARAPSRASGGAAPTR